VFAVATLASLSISVREASLLLGLFFAQFILGALAPAAWQGTERVAIAVVYLVLAAAILVQDRRRLPALLRDGFRTSHDDLRAAG